MKILFRLMLALALLTAPLAAQITPVGPSLNLPAAGCVTINADSFICRSIAGTFTVGTTKNGTDGTLKPGGVQTADGTASATAYGFASNTNLGFYRQTTNVLSMAIAGSDYIDYTGAQIRLAANVTLGWNATNDNAAGTSQDTTLARGGVGEITITSVVFANLGTPASGTITYCSDCTETTAASCPVTQASCVCTNGGGGAFARRVNGAWYCTF